MSSDLSVATSNPPAWEDLMMTFALTVFQAFFLHPHRRQDEGCVHVKFDSAEVVCLRVSTMPLACCYIVCVCVCVCMRVCVWYVCACVRVCGV